MHYYVGLGTARNMIDDDEYKYCGRVSITDSNKEQALKRVDKIIEGKGIVNNSRQSYKNRLHKVLLPADDYLLVDDKICKRGDNDVK